MHNLSLIVVFPLLLIAGCDAAENSNTEINNAVPDTAISTDDDAADHKGLTPGYLVGDWCYTHYQAIDPSTQTLNREEINQNFMFSEDGTYITQQDSGAPMTTEGKYEFLPQGVFKLIIGKAGVVSVNPDDFVLHKTVDHFFYRGACKQEK